MMPGIRILPEILANKIAAGEVVERPASVVKELVENALDAQSDRIFIDIENGGRTLIQVSDNGTGMHHDDALMALERFATSKISSDDDLFSIQTLGFRGEALPSIAAVSKLTLVTRPEDARNGVEIQVEGGKIMRVTEVGAPRGTLIRVSRLFFNTPARRKFLKTVPTEMGHIADAVAGLALGRPHAQVTLKHNAKTVKKWLRASDPAERAADVLGRLAADELLRVAGDDGYLDLDGYLAPLKMVRGTARGIYLFVNGRRVRDRIVQHALIEGCRGRLMKGRFPLAVLFLKLPFDQVDVNVHPTKHEIRFADQRRVHNTIRNAVHLALDRNERRLWAVDGQKEDEIPLSTPVAMEPARPYSHPPSEGYPRRRIPAVSDSFFAAKAPLPDKPWRMGAGGGTDETKKNHPPDLEIPPQTTAGEQQPLWQAQTFADLTVIGQFRGTYIICQSGNDLILIDQHAAHERIVYEQLKQRAGRIESQQLLMPETVDLGFAEARALEPLLPRLNEMGLEIEPFGGNTFAVKAFPVMLDDHDFSAVVGELAEKALELGTETDLETMVDECRMVMACHNAIRANQRLTDLQINSMLAQLDRCDNPSHCPHGRPTWVRWTLRDLEKAFKRIV